MDKRSAFSETTSSDCEYLVNLVHPGAYAAPHEYLEEDELALDFCRLFKHRCGQLGKKCYFPHEDTLGGRRILEEFGKIQESSKYTIVIFTENSMAESALKQFYHENIVLKCITDPMKNYIAVILGKGTLPWYMKNKVPAYFKKVNWSEQVDEWKRLFKGMRTEVRNELLEEWKNDIVEEFPPVVTPVEVSRSDSEVGRGYNEAIGTIETTVSDPEDRVKTQAVVDTRPQTIEETVAEAQDEQSQSGDGRNQENRENITENLGRMDIRQASDESGSGIANIPHFPVPKYKFEKRGALGGAVIFFNYKFGEPCFNSSDQKLKRTGSNVDVTKFQKLFQKKWQYDFVKHEGLSKQKIKHFFTEENLQNVFNNKRFTRVLIIVSSHGELSNNGEYVFVVSNKDEKKTEEYPVEEFINSTRQNLRKSLIKPGLPIVFLFSTCHGTDMLYREDEQPDCIRTSGGTGEVENISDEESEEEPEDEDDGPNKEPVPVPKTADLFVGYAQTRGAKAWRSPYTGTRYLKNLYKVLKETEATTGVDLGTAHTIAQRRVAREGNHNQVQQPAFYSTLRKQIYLVPTEEERQSMTQRNQPIQ